VIFKVWPGSINPSLPNLRGAQRTGFGSFFSWGKDTAGTGGICSGFLEYFDLFFRVSGGFGWGCSGFLE
jgi:hypothetical protein